MIKGTAVLLCSVLVLSKCHQISAADVQKFTFHPTVISVFSSKKVVHNLELLSFAGLTNYPIGVGINAAGEVTIADNHNNFNLSVFSQDGKLLSALESKVKHAQCFDVALMDDGSVVLASKDYRLYIYRYIQLPPIGM